MFGANPVWSQKLCVWGKVGVVAEGKDSKTGDRGATMMFFGYTERKSASVRMWDSRTARVVVEGKDSKTGNRDTTMIFAGYAKCKSDSL